MSAFIIKMLQANWTQNVCFQLIVVSHLYALLTRSSCMTKTFLLQIIFFFASYFSRVYFFFFWRVVTNGKIGVVMFVIYSYVCLSNKLVFLSFCFMKKFLWFFIDCLSLRCDKVCDRNGFGCTRKLGFKWNLILSVF